MTTPDPERLSEVNGSPPLVGDVDVFWMRPATPLQLSVEFVVSSLFVTADAAVDITAAATGTFFLQFMPPFPGNEAI